MLQIPSDRNLSNRPSPSSNANKVANRFRSNEKLIPDSSSSTYIIDNEIGPKPKSDTSTSYDEFLQSSLAEWLNEEKNIPHLAVNRLLNKLSVKFDIPKTATTLLKKKKTLRVKYPMVGTLRKHASLLSYKFYQYVLITSKVIRLDGEFHVDHFVMLIFHLETFCYCTR